MTIVEVHWVKNLDFVTVCTYQLMILEHADEGGRNVGRDKFIR